MKRLMLLCAGVASMALATGCCCDWCNLCQPCGSPCGPGGYGAPYAAPPAGAYLTPAGAPVIGALPGAYYPVTAAVVPIESLPTY
jgi:hypothetical protein